MNLPISSVEADDLLERVCIKPLIEKTRYHIRHGSRVWDVDEYHGANEGLVIAEVELHDSEEPLEFPGWVGREVTTDHRFANSRLVVRPFSTWASEL